MKNSHDEKVDLIVRKLVEVQRAYIVNRINWQEYRDTRSWLNALYVVAIQEVRN